MRLAMYAGASMVLATSVILRALHERANFYSACVYLAQSNACLMILTNLALLGVGTFMLGLQRLFFGTLRPIEVEQLYEKAWFAITETCLAMTIFREEVGAYFLVMFVSLLIGKVWGWIGEGRVEILEQQPPANPRLFHIRLSMSLLISTLFDLYMLLYSVQTVLQQARPNMMVVFAFEFAVLHVTSLSTAARYTVSLYEASVLKNQMKTRRDQIRQERAQAQQQAATSEGQEQGQTSAADVLPDEDVDNLEIDVPGWEEKGRWVFYLDLATDFFKLILYLTFFFVLCMFYGMPIHIIRDVALTIRSFYKRINDFLKYRQATRDMNDRYPDASPEEVARENVCIICREDMTAWAQPAAVQNPPNANAQPGPAPTPPNERTRPKKLPCGHVLHFSCLRSWLERQQNCPTCRRPVLVSGNTALTSGPNAPNQNAGATPAPNQQQAGQVPHPAHPAGQGPAVHQNVFNLGPFRLAFGARIGRGVPPQINNPGAPNQQLPGELQGFGNPFGFFGQPQAHQQNNARFTPPNISAQLHQIEQQLMREVNSLRAQSDQLYLVRALQGELARLRIQQAQGNQAQMMNGAVTLNQQRPPIITGQGVQTTAIPPPGSNQPFAMPQVFTSGQQQRNMGPGHPDLPPDMTLPGGWTVLPLQRIAAGNTAGSSTTEAPTESFSSQQPPSSQAALISTETQASASSNIDATASGSQPSNENVISAPPSSAAPESSIPQPPSITHGTAEPSQAQSLPPSNIPQWGSAPPPSSNKPDSAAGTKAGLTPTSLNGTARPPHATSEAEPSSSERREAKGKGKAVTIEDSVEDVD